MPERCSSLDTIHTQAHLFTEMDKLVCILPESSKRNVVLLQLRSLAPEIYTALAMEKGMTFHRTLGEIKKISALNSAVDGAKKSNSNASIFYSNNNHERKRIDKEKNGKSPLNSVFGASNSDTWSDSAQVKIGGRRES